MYDSGQFERTGRHVGKLLIIDDDQDILTAARLLLRREFGDVIANSTPEAIPELMDSHDFDAILLDMNFGPGESSGEQGLHWLERILGIDPQMVVVMITAHGSLNTAVEAMKRGATDFIAKPWQNEKVIATVSAAVGLRASRRETRELRQANRLLTEDSIAQDLVIASEEMRQVMTLVDRAGPSDANVLILGENGTG